MTVRDVKYVNGLWIESGLFIILRKKRIYNAYMCYEKKSRTTHQIL